MGLLDGRRALVTGGASGIGFATSSRLLAEGAKVAIVDINKDSGEIAAKELGAEFVECDVTDRAQVEKAFAKASDLLGGLDVAHLNAGVTTRSFDLSEVSLEEYQRVFSINADGVFFGIQACAQQMKGGGSIVCTASIAGINAYPPDPVYAATKHAVVGFVRSLAPQLEARKITINCICPGIVDTPLIDPGRAILEQSGFPLIPPTDIAEAVVRAITEGRTGEAWVVQPGREPLVYQFRGVPGPRVAGKEGALPPGIRR